MPATNEDKNPKGDVIRFNEESHTYTCSCEKFGLPYTSVTTFVHTYAQPFDEVAIATQCSQKSGKPVEEYLAEWEKTRNDACVLGTRTHETAEDCLLNRQPRNQPNDAKEKAYFKVAWDAAKAIKAKMKVWAVEKIVFDTTLKIAGTADLITIDSEGTYWVMDWKTNSHLDDTSRYDQVMLPPVNHLADCNVNHYSLQLATYEYILKRNAYIPSNAKVNRMIIHITPEGYKTKVLPSRAIEVRDLALAHICELLNLPF